MCARQPGWVAKTKGWESDPNACIYVITQAAAFPARSEAPSAASAGEPAAA